MVMVIADIFTNFVLTAPIPDESITMPAKTLIDK